MMRSAQRQMILACTHASINECMYVHCMMIKQNHNKLNNEKVLFYCGVCEDTTSSLIFKKMMFWSYRWCGYLEKLCFSTCLAYLSGFSCSLLTTYEACASRLFRCVGLSCKSPRRWHARVRCCSLDRLHICGLRYWRSLYPPLTFWWTSGALPLMRVGGWTGSINLEIRLRRHWRFLSGG